jgi:deazaflavin-dependent oxidoreductase (nitroreductase family)
MVYPAMARVVSRLADRAAAAPPTREPFAARLHFVPRALRRPHAWLVRALRGYFERAPGWVILTTRGRRTGLPREVLLPCERTPDALIVISTYHWRSDWIRNLRDDPRVSVTCAGWIIPARAEVIEDPAAKRALISAHPFFPAAPFVVVHAVLRTILRPLLLPWMRRWVAPRPLVVIRREG